MTVRDPNRDIMLRGDLQNHRTQAVLMDMNNFVLRVFIKEAIQRR